jgi:hypothetical protein
MNAVLIMPSFRGNKFPRLAKGNSVVDRYREGRMSNSGRARLAPVESIPFNELARVESGPKEEA